MADEMTAPQHLWEANHPYYCSGANYFSNDVSSEYETWADFLEEWGDADLDLSLVFRFDWADMDDEANWPGETKPGADELALFVMSQRKGLFQPITVAVQKNEETAIIEWLKPRYERMLKLWTPFQ